MYKHFILMATVLAISLASTASAQDKPDTTDAKPKIADHAKGAVDPLNLGKQRQLFLKAAGKDSELSASEFEADRKSGNGFARPFDKWSNVSRFDRDGNKTLDWFEASAYRSAVRKNVLAAYDKNNDRKLKAGEREAANKALASGNIGRLNFPSRGGADAPRADNNNDRRDRGDRRRGDRDENRPRPSIAHLPKAKPREQIEKEYQAIRADLRKKHDKNGNGEIDGDERRAYWEEYRKIQRDRFMARYDTNKDGDLSREERAVAGEDFRQRREKEQLARYDTNKDGKIDDDERRKQREAERQRWIERRYDRNRDGKLDDNERAEMVKAQKEREQRRADFMKKWDKDGDGDLSEKEREAVRTYAREQMTKIRAEITKKYDKDGDGEIDRDQRDAARREFFQKYREAGVPFGGFDRGRRGRGGPGGFDRSRRGRGGDNDRRDRRDRGNDNTT